MIMKKKKLRICLLSAYSGSINRGIESWADEISRRLSKNGHQVRVYQLGNADKKNYEVKKIDLKVGWNRRDTSWTISRILGLDYWSKLLGEFTLKLLPDLVEFAPDIVIPLNGNPETQIIKKHCQSNGAKLVLVGHWDDKQSLRQNPDLYIAITDRQKKWAESIYRGRVEVIASGVDLKRFSPEGEKYPLEISRPVILTVGALTKGKNIDRTIRAVSQIPQAGLVVCGNGDLEGQYFKLGKQLLGERFQLLCLDQKEMPSLYRACDLFTLVPDKFEAFGLVFLEAMACGLGVVTIDDAVRKEIVSDAGFFVKKTESSEYPLALQKALHTDFRSARKQAEKYSWEQVIKKYERVFLDLY